MDGTCMDRRAMERGCQVEGGFTSELMQVAGQVGALVSEIF